MFRVLDIATKIILGTIFAVVLIGRFSAAQAGSFKVLHSFSGATDGCYPVGGVILDGAGNLYGTTGGGACNSCGTVFKLAPNGTETLLHDFTCGGNGQEPAATLVMDKKGNLYGTTVNGGSIGCGVIFKVTPAGREKTVHDFAGPPTDGCSASAPLVMDANGKFYGTTSGGGKHREGNVFKLAPDGTETVTHSFNSRRSGDDPVAGLVMDVNGNLYGVDSGGGAKDFGTAFEIAPDGAETLLHTFRGSPRDGSVPDGTLISDQSGNFYGTLRDSGLAGCDANEGCGGVFKLAPGRYRNDSPFLHR
ncbi:MAG TPA: choice-of-anchor tandem repeat GloVer-containing protein [Rhizomicrobium sp.]|nr:choice-of-anchor tandem repeat GloVer-containing protein [Rhizomicrobium sp.]